MYKLTIEQKDLLFEKLYAPLTYFNPIEIDGIWYISKEEVEQNTIEEFNWINDLEFIIL